MGQACRRQGTPSPAHPPVPLQGGRSRGPHCSGAEIEAGDLPKALQLVEEQNRIRTQVWLSPSQCPARVQGEEWREVRSVLS